MNFLVAALGPSYKWYLIPGTDTATGQNSALVTRVDPATPLERTSNRVNTPVTGSSCGSTATGSTTVSKHARTTFVLSRLKFDLVFAHFKSGGQASDCLQREGQAKVLLDTFINTALGRSIIVMGDLNDWDSSFADAAGNQGSSRTLALLKSGGGGLNNVGATLPLANRSTSSVGLIDHVLLSNDLAQPSTFLGASVDGSGYPTSSSARLAAFYSDHLPVIVTLRDGASAFLVVAWTVIIFACLF